MLSLVLVLFAVRLLSLSADLQRASLMQRDLDEFASVMLLCKLINVSL